MGMKEIASGRIGQVAAKYGEHAPMATVCCNACRTCVTTNIIGIATAALASTGLSLSRLFRVRRRAHRALFL
jgi:hypothetical protein